MEELNEPIEAPEPTKTDEVETVATDAHDWEAEAKALKAENEKWKALSRKWEGRAKASADNSSQASEVEEVKALLAQAEKEIEGMKAANAVANWKTEASKKYNVPVDVLRGDTEEEITAHAEMIQNAINSAKPARLVVPDSGEPHKVDVSKESILSIKNEKERLAAIREHSELFI